ncbi:MAG TPA: anhydro-N-acetylmuramic acid kinase, partial [Armatimonadota bacterium]|nr:anhydro-N-acetylmuramic acid kinase [Armatimonadota bacterium]
MRPAEILARYAGKTKRVLVGLMSGTSVDAVTAAVVELSGEVPDISVELKGYVQHPMPEQIAWQVPRHAHRDAADVTRLNVEIGELFAEAALAVMGE